MPDPKPQYAQVPYQGASPVLATANTLYQSAQLTAMNTALAVATYAQNSLAVGPMGLIYDGTNYVYYGSLTYIYFG